MKRKANSKKNSSSSKRSKSSRKAPSRAKKPKIVGNVDSSDEDYNENDITFQTRMYNFSDENLDMKNHEQNHETAIMLHYLNSGLLRFNLDKVSSNKHYKYIKSKIRDEITTSDQIEQMLKTFFEERGMSHITEDETLSNKAPIFGCGLCGICLPHRGNWEYQNITISDIKPMAKLSADQQSNYKKIYKNLSIYLLTTKIIHKHSIHINSKVCINPNWKMIHITIYIQNLFK